MTFPARYHDTAVLLFTMDGVSPRAIAGRFGAAEGEVQAVLIAAGAMGPRGLSVTPRRWKNSLEAAHGRQDIRSAPSPRFFDEDDRIEADRRHVNSIISALGGRGFPFLDFDRKAA